MASRDAGRESTALASTERDAGAGASCQPITPRGAVSRARAQPELTRGAALRIAVLDRAEALDLDAHDVARLEEARRVHRHADAARRAGEDKVARLERASSPR